MPTNGKTATRTTTKSPTGAANGKPKPKVKLTVRNLPGDAADDPHKPKHAGGRPTAYKPDYAEQAYKLCSTNGYTDAQLAAWFNVHVATIHRWRAEHPEFCEACRVGKGETDNLVERHAIAHIGGYYVEVEELDKFGVKHKLQKWIPGNAHAAMKWLSSRRPEVYREQQTVKHQLSMDDAFLRFLDQMEAQHTPQMLTSSPPIVATTYRDGDLQTPHREREVIDVQAVEVDEG